MRDNAVENKLLKKPQLMLYSSFNLENGTITTPLLIFYISLGLNCTRIHRFVQYTPRKCFNIFLQSVVDAKRGGDENSDSNVVAETMKLLVIALTVVRLWTEANIKRPNILMMRRRTKQSIEKFLSG